MSTTTTTLTPAPAGAAGPAPSKAAAPGEGRIGLRANLRHIGALARRNLLQIKKDPESMFDVLLMPVIFTLLDCIPDEQLDEVSVIASSSSSSSKKK